MTSGRDLARAGLIVSAAFLVSRVLGWVRTIVIVNAFAVPADLDVFFAAFRIPDLIFQLVAAGALSSALIPIVSALMAKEATARAWRVVSTVATIVVLALAGLGIVMFIAAPILVPVITPGFDAARTALTVDLTRIMLLSAILLALGSVATSVLNAGGRFAAAAVAPIAYNVAIIAAALVLAPSMGVVGLAVGVVVGAALHVLIQLRPMARLGFRYSPGADLGDPEARRALRLMAPRAIGLGATQITFVVVTSLATTLGAGAVTSFTVAFTLLQIPIGVIGVPLGVVVLPSLAREAAVGREVDFAGLLTRALRLLVFVMVPIGALLAILREATVALLFDYGRFDAAAQRQTSDALAAFLVGLAAHAMIAVLARSFYARQDTLTPVIAAVGAVVVNTTLAVALVGPLGLPGIALAIAIAAWLEALTLIVILRRRLEHLDLRPLGRVALAAVGGTLVATAAGLAALSVTEGVVGVDPDKLGLILQVATVGLAFVATYLAISVVLRVPELPSIVGVMVDALRRPRRT